MNIRTFDPSDLEILKELHAKHFGEEFELPQFHKGYHCAITFEADNGIILIGGIRPIAELVCVTNKDMPTKERVIALKEMVKIGVHVCNYNGYDQMHCFLQGKPWMRQVQTVGFRPTVGRSFVIDTV